MNNRSKNRPSPKTKARSIRPTTRRENTRPTSGKKNLVEGMYYNEGFLNGPKKKLLIEEIENLHPIWEERFSKSNPPPAGDIWRPLLRPVYWLGNWQFACLGYYHPPHNIEHACMQAEAFPPFMQKMVREIEFHTRKMVGAAVPEEWCLNTCLVNYYGTQTDENGKKTDVARVGDHRDAELGPVASVSLGESAYFQFVKGKQADPNNIVHSQWLNDGSLLVFWSDKFKNELLHRVQRVKSDKDTYFEDHLDNYQTRRINLTFRYVPDKSIYPYSEIPQLKKDDVQEYVNTLAQTSDFYKNL